MIKNRLLNLAAALFIFITFPASAFADGADTSTTSPDSSTTATSTPLVDDPSNPVASLDCATQDYSKLNGVLQPNGAAALTYTYNKDTCLWENDYYTWSPVTKAYTPKYNTDYTWNPLTGMWDTTRWVYNTAKGKYTQVTVSVAPSYLMPAPGSTSSDPSANSAINGNTGPGSTNGTSSNSNNNLTLNSNFNITVSNNITQLAISGDVSVLKDTYAGSGQSGNASDILNILNMLQASWDIQGAGDLMTFVTNINGDVTGDLLLDPNAITGPGSTSTNQSNTTNNLTVNSQENGQIDNNVNLVAQSGDVNVSQNTSAGNATSGNAQVIANLVNMIDSAIMAGKSFIGVININGDLNGDILLPPNFLDQLIASGAPSATVSISNNNNTVVNATANSTQTINNNTQLNAQSGDVNSSQNTEAGNAASGSAVTKLTIFNLTGRQVIGTNSLLVFVNVVGTWVGMILDAPGANSAAFCGGTCTSSTNTNTNATLTDNSNQTINNNLNLNAKSGDVSATENTQVGNATSGDASASANILNIENSKLSLSNWFGILFINVLGTWHGSFGLNTDAGDPLAGGMGGGNGSTTPQVFRFVVPKTNGSATSINNAVSSLLDQASQQTGQSKAQVAGASTSGPKINGPSAGSSKWIVPVISTIAGLVLLSSEQMVAATKRSKYGQQLKVGFGQAVHSLRILLL